MHATFLADICDHPGDDTPRLVYADWLAENGDEARGEFIRLQCRTPGTPRESELLRLYEEQWVDALPCFEGITWGLFTRGFVEDVIAVTPAAFLRHAEAVFAASPVRRLRVLRASFAIEDLVDSPTLLRLTELNLGNRSGITVREVRELAWSPNVANLTALLLHQNPLGERTLLPLSFAPHLCGLRELYVSGVGAGDEDAEALTNRVLSGLDLLDLRDNRITDAGAVALACWPGPGLGTLELVNNQIGPPGGTQLALTPNLPRLKRLQLGHNRVGDATALALACSPHRAALRELDLRYCGITDEGAMALAESPLARQLHEITLAGNPITRQHSWHALRSSFAERLRG